MKYVYRLGKIVPKEAAQYAGGNRGPYVIRDEMPPTEQVDGVFYTSKAKFRAKGRELGLIEVGNEKVPAKHRATETPEYKKGLRETSSASWRNSLWRAGVSGEDRSRRTMPRWRG